VTRIHHGLDVNVPGAPGSGSADKTQAAPGQTTQPQTQAQPGLVSQPAEVQITPTAQLLASLEQQISSTPDINQSRVDPIRQALSDGSYQVDSSRVADGLLAAQKFDAQAAQGSGAGTQSTSAKAFVDTAQLGSDRSG
jgi:negative regulator of flagellin synthesis FlgM